MDPPTTDIENNDPTKCEFLCERGISGSEDLLFSMMGFLCQSVSELLSLDQTQES